jgi:hypothetical protein
MLAAPLLGPGAGSRRLVLPDEDHRVPEPRHARDLHEAVPGRIERHRAASRPSPTTP